MMLSRPIASGAMLVLLVAAVGGAALQQGDETPEAGVVEVSDVPDAEISSPAGDVAETEAPAVENAEPEPEEVTERTATAPNRVVESAGFPVVPQAERDRGQAETAGPVVTVNGRPLGTDGAETEVAQEPAEVPAETAPAADTGLDATETQVAVIEPPLPRPRPADLPTAEPSLDYDAIAGAAYGDRAADIAVPQERRELEPMPGVSEFAGNYDPREDELVGVVGPNGEVIWVYEEQVQGMNNSRVSVQRPQPVNPFGFVYE